MSAFDFEGRDSSQRSPSSCREGRKSQVRPSPVWASRLHQHSSHCQSHVVHKERRRGSADLGSCVGVAQSQASCKVPHGQTHAPEPHRASCALRIRLCLQNPSYAHESNCVQRVMCSSEVADACTRPVAWGLRATTFRSVSAPSIVRVHLLVTRHVVKSTRALPKPESQVGAQGMRWVVGREIEWCVARPKGRRPTRKKIRALEKKSARLVGGARLFDILGLGRVGKSAEPFSKGTNFGIGEHAE